MSINKQEHRHSYAKAILGPSFLECHRYYGSNTKSESINWTAFSLNSVPSLTKKHDVTVIAANNDLSGSTMKFIQMNSRCMIKAGQIPGSTNGGNEPVTEFVSEVSNGIDVANVDVILPTGGNESASLASIILQQIEEREEARSRPAAAQTKAEEQVALEIAAAAPCKNQYVHGIEWLD